MRRVWAALGLGAAVFGLWAPGAVAQEAKQGETPWQNCWPYQLAMYPDRIHVRCGSMFYAVETNSPLAPLVVALALHVRENPIRRLVIEYSGSAANNPPGCLAQDCRRITAVRTMGSGLEGTN